MQRHTGFFDAYCTLMDIIIKRKKAIVPGIEEYQRKFKGMNLKDMDVLIVQFSEQMTDNMERIQIRDQEFLKGEDCPQIWKDINMYEILQSYNQNASSLENLWLHIETICNAAREYACNEDIPAPGNTKAASEAADGNMGLGSIAQALTPDVTNKLQGLAEKYSQNMSNGTIQDLNMNTVMSDVVSLLSNEDISGVVNNLETMFSKFKT
jgi:hypothetical protein